MVNTHYIISIQGVNIIGRLSLADHQLRHCCHLEIRQVAGDGMN